MQSLAEGNRFVGSGDQGQFTEFASDDGVLFDASLAKPAQTCRAYVATWEDHPAQPPSVAVTSASAGHATVYASWNGATGVASWEVLAGETPDDLSVVASAAPDGFETSVPVTTALPQLPAILDPSSCQTRRTHRGDSFSKDTLRSCRQTPMLYSSAHRSLSW